MQLESKLECLIKWEKRVRGSLANPESMLDIQLNFVLKYIEVKWNGTIFKFSVPNKIRLLIPNSIMN